MKPTWYISFEPRARATPRRYRRETKTFPTEKAAMDFARAIFPDSSRIAAGTLNPVRPKRVIASKHLLSSWLGHH